MLLILFLSFIWITCGVLHFGLDYAFWQRQYPDMAREREAHDFRQALIVSLFGVPALLAQLTFSTCHGFLYRRINRIKDGDEDGAPAEAAAPVVVPVAEVPTPARRLPVSAPPKRRRKARSPRKARR